MKQTKLFKTSSFSGVPVAILPAGTHLAPLEAGEPKLDLGAIAVSEDALAVLGGQPQPSKSMTLQPILATRRWIHAEDVLRFEQMFEEIAIGRSKLRIDEIFPGPFEAAVGVVAHPAIGRSFREKILRAIAYLLATPTGRSIVDAVVELATPTVVRPTIDLGTPSDDTPWLAAKALRGERFSESECADALADFAMASADPSQHPLSSAKYALESMIREKYTLDTRRITRRGAVSTTDQKGCTILLTSLKPLVDNLAALRKASTAPAPNRTLPASRPASIYLMPAWTNSVFYSRKSSKRPPPLACPYAPNGVSDWAEKGYSPFFLTLAHELIHVVHGENPVHDWSLLDHLERALLDFDGARPASVGPAAMAVAHALDNADEVDEVWTSTEELSTIVGPGLTETMLRCENGLAQRFGHGSWVASVPAGTTLQMTPERWLRLFRKFGPSEVVGDYCGVAAPSLIARLARG